jgi:ribosomal protein S18 acetylase RimI-like enzyme
MAALSSVRLREPRPDDASRCGELLFDTWPHLYHALLGDPRRAHGVLARLFAAPGNTFSFDATRVAECAGRVVGLAASYPADQGQQRARASIGPALRALGPIGFARVLGAVWRIADASMGVDPRHYYVANVAVAADTRGGGLGTLLLADAEVQARRRGLRGISLELEGNDPVQARRRGLRGISLELEGNDPVIRHFYERAGYQIVEERHSQQLRRLTGNGHRLLMSKELP